MKIGVGITTYNRFERFKECFENLLKNRRDVDKIIIVDDASTIDRERYDAYFKNILFNDVAIVVNEKNKGVAGSKNIILKRFYDEGFDYIFTIEDDINVINPDVFTKYIQLSKDTGFEYINFGLHGKLNKREDAVKVHYDLGEFWLFRNIIGAFSLHTRFLIEEIGYYDAIYLNAMEHVDYCYVASKRKLTTPFNKFIDLYESDKYLREQANSLEDSSIRMRPDWATNVERAFQYWEVKHGVSFQEVRYGKQKS